MRRGVNWDEEITQRVGHWNCEILSIFFLLLHHICTTSYNVNNHDWSVQGPPTSARTATSEKARGNAIRQNGKKAWRVLRWHQLSGRTDWKTATKKRLPEPSVVWLAYHSHASGHHSGMIRSIRSSAKVCIVNWLLQLYWIIFPYSQECPKPRRKRAPRCSRLQIWWTENGRSTWRVTQRHSANDLLLSEGLNMCSI